MKLEDNNLENSEELEIEKEDVKEEEDIEEAGNNEENELSDEDLKRIRRNIEKRKKLKEREAKLSKRSDKKRYKIAGIVAIVAGVLELGMGLIRDTGAGSNLVLGSTFICLGYLYLMMGKRSKK